jgi:acyl-coenzyme A synthetase/AMP-(fatty) acid ligase
MRCLADHVIEFRDMLPREETGKIFMRKLRDEYAARRNG